MASMYLGTRRYLYKNELTAKKNKKTASRKKRTLARASRKRLKHR